MPRSQPSRSSTSASPRTSTTRRGRCSAPAEDALPVGLYARTSDGTTTRDTPITGVDPTQPHDYEIVWTSTSFDYYVDGTQVDSAPITIATPMSPQISDFNTGNPVTVDSMKLTTSPPTYRSSGTYTSPVFDGGSGFITGITLNAYGHHADRHDDRV